MSYVVEVPGSLLVQHIVATAHIVTSYKYLSSVISLYLRSEYRDACQHQHLRNAPMVIAVKMDPSVWKTSTMREVIAAIAIESRTPYMQDCIANTWPRSIAHFNKKYPRLPSAPMEEHAKCKFRLMQLIWDVIV